MGSGLNLKIPLNSGLQSELEIYRVGFGVESVVKVGPPYVYGMCVVCM